MIFVLFDENLSHRVKMALEAVRTPQGVQVESVRGRGEEGTPDPVLLSTLASQGPRGSRRVLITGDGMIRYREAERAACQAGGVIVFFVPTRRYWRTLRRYGQAAYLLRWFPAIVAVSREADRGAQFQLPRTWVPHTELRPLKAVLSQTHMRRMQRKAER